uniref:Uncharacterized protein n=1 Tax=Romanomermis culicivorax TaxID=13658 RepID=A0A915HHI3_ROMCU
MKAEQVIRKVELGDSCNDFLSTDCVPTDQEFERKRANLVEIYEKESDDMAKRLELMGEKLADERNKFQVKSTVEPSLSYEFYPRSIYMTRKPRLGNV